jgi:hypothetical protein
MKNVILSLVFGSLLIASAAHAEDNITRPEPRGGMMMIGSGTPPMMDGQRGPGKPQFMMYASGTPPMMGSGTPMMGCKNFSRSLSQGQRGDDVRDLQEMLREGGFLDASSTGFFGPMTKKAVIAFQKENGLNPSGFFGELSRKAHGKRCGEGRGLGKDKDEWKNGTSTMPLPCMTAGASSTGCEHSNAFPQKREDRPCKTNFDPSTGKPCNQSGSTTPPSGIMCTMEARLCADGTMMPRDNMCGWHPEGCKPATTTASSTQ